MAVSNKSSVLVRSFCSTVDSDCVVKELCREIGQTHVSIPDEMQSETGRNSCCWHLETRYYTANVELVAFTEDWFTSRPTADLSSFEAIILYFDPNNFSVVESFTETMFDRYRLDASVKLLLCEELPQSSRLQRWCIENADEADSKFELVELNPSEVEEDDVDIIGYARVVNALRACEWSNMVLNTDSFGTIPMMSDALVKASSGLRPSLTPVTDDEQNSPESLGYVPLAQSEEAADSKLLPKPSIADQQHEIDERLLKKLSTNTADTDDGCDDFDKLFEQFAELKAQAGTITNDDERKRFAENVVTRFWNAIAGDPDELDGLTDDSSDGANDEPPASSANTTSDKTVSSE